MARSSAAAARHCKPPINISEEHGVRYLHFGSNWIQGAMRMARPWALELDYIQNMMFPLLLKRGEWPKRVLQVGLGAASIVKFLHRYRPDARQTVVEIAPSVVQVARQYFKLPDESAHLTIEIADGVEYLTRSEQNFDLILIDGFDANAEAGELDTAHFYALCRTRLAHGGMLVVNLLKRSRGHKIGVIRLIDAFQGRVLTLPETADGNTVAIATEGAGICIGEDALLQRVRALRREAKLNLEPLVAELFVERAEAVLRF